MRDTFFEKWLEEKIERDPKTGKRIFSGDESDKYKQLKLKLDTEAKESAEKKKQRQFGKRELRMSQQF